MSQELKHVGRVKETGKRCIVAFRTLPGDAHNCLIVPTESLSDAYHNAIINLVESPAGQGAYEFAEAMNRTQFPDGSTMLPALHSQGRLVKIPTDKIEMVPAPGVSVLLSELNQIIAEQRGVAIDDLSLKEDYSAQKRNEAKETAKVKETATTPAKDDPSRTTSASVNATEVVAPEGSAEDQAKFYRSQADRLAKEAAAMRRKAEELAPTKKK